MKKNRWTDKRILVLLIILCAGLIVTSLSLQSFSHTLQNYALTLVVPIQTGVNNVGKVFSGITDGFRDSKELSEQLGALKKENAELKEENLRYSLMEDELHRLEDLYKLDREYPNYEKVAAEIVSKDPGNWYSRFIVNKGSQDGIKPDMNVLAGGALYGIVTEVGPNWCAIRTIIDDESNISAMTSSTSDICTVTGSLLDFNQGTIRFYGLQDENDRIIEGERIITSNISEKYLPGFTIGYVSFISKDANNLTKSGRIVPAADFSSVREVLIVLSVKEELEEIEPEE